MSDMVRIKMHVGTGFAGCSHDDVCEIPRDEWDAMSKEQQENTLDQLAVDFRDYCIDCSAWVED